MVSGNYEEITEELLFAPEAGDKNSDE